MVGFDPQAYLARTRQIESGGRDNAVSSTGAAGPFQFTLGTAARYGLSPQDRFNFEKSQAAALRLAMDNAAHLRKVLGRDPTSAEVYLAHQQGAAGAGALLSHPGMPASQALSLAGLSPARAAQAIAVNGGNPNAPASAFAGKWLSKFDGGRSMPMMASAAPSMATPSEAPQLDIAPPPAPEAEPDAPEMSYAMAGEEGTPGYDQTNLADLNQPMNAEFEMTDATSGAGQSIHQKAAMRKQKVAELTTPLGQLFNEQVVGMAGKGRA